MKLLPLLVSLIFLSGCSTIKNNQSMVTNTVINNYFSATNPTFAASQLVASSLVSATNVLFQDSPELNNPVLDNLNP